MPGRRGDGTLARMTSIDPGADIGHVHLHVADLGRAVSFYRDVLGFRLNGRIADQLGFLAAGDYHHHIGLNTFAPPGLYHAAIRYPSRAALATAVGRVLDHGHAISHGSDHGANEAVYLTDPDGNGLELYWDRPRAHWPRTADGALALVNLPLDVDELLGEAVAGRV
jgi:catechol 2,3-dioxygenase